MSFVHLHLHTHFSLLDGLGKPEDYIKKAALKHKSPAVAITDHGVMYGAIEFYQKCKEYNIKPIIGCEAYICSKSRLEKDPNDRYYHIILLAKNLSGYQNLMKLCTHASKEGFYYRPRIDYELLQKYSEGIIALSACLAGEIPSAILKNKGDLSKAREIALKMNKIFGKDHFYLEVQNHPKIAEQDEVNQKIIELAKETKIPLIATNDCHYSEKNDNHAHDVLICIQTGKKVTDDDRMKYVCDFSMKSPEEMREDFKENISACDNTLKIAEMCDLKIPLNNDLLPPFRTPENETPEKYLEKLCEVGLIERYGKNPPEEIKKRLLYELGVITKMGFASYFLIVYDFVNYAKKQNIVVGPGRGSAAGSIISYCLKITDIDPLKYNLLFERFLNPERISMPDIDIDFADKRRDEVFAYVQNKYGEEKVSQIITFGTMAARAAIRDSGRALGYSYSDVDKIAKAIPLKPGTKLKAALKEEVELQKIYKSDENAKKILDTAVKLEGCVRHASVHACAVVISPNDLTNYTPLQKTPGADTEGIITQYSMKPLEKIGLLKMDFLGLKNLSIMETCLNIIKKIKPKDKSIDLNKIDLNDKKTFELLQEGKTTGVFQLESAGMKRYLKELKPTCFEDIIAMVSLYRPGPMEWIPSYIKGKNNQNKINYFHASLEEILKETYGIAVYQEQILQIAQKFAGFTLGEADILRRAIGKKIASELNSQRSKFIEGSLKQGHDQKLTIKIFDEVIEPFAGYGFNKSHAACYAMIAFQTAFLKAHYPAEFMAALLTADDDNTDRIVIEISECHDLGINILPPSINESLADFTVINDKNIRFGLNAIKGVGIGTVNEIIKSREKEGKFKNLEDFIKRMPTKLINKKTLESLALSGSMDEIGERNQIKESIPEITTFAKSMQGEKNDNQTDIFGLIKENMPTFKLKETTKATSFQKLLWEKEYLGIYVSGHPLQGLKKYLSKKAKILTDLQPKDIGKNIKIAGLITTLKTVFTKTGQKMAYFEVEDPSAKIEVIAFPKIYGSAENILRENNMLILEGRMERRKGKLQFMAQNIKAISYEKMLENAKKNNLYYPKEKISITSLKIEKEKNSAYIIEINEKSGEETLLKLKKLLLENKGEQEVEINIQKNKKKQRIKVPFGINLTEDLKEQIAEIIKV